MSTASIRKPASPDQGVDLAVEMTPPNPLFRTASIDVAIALLVTRELGHAPRKPSVRLGPVVNLRTDHRTGKLPLDSPDRDRRLVVAVENPPVVEFFVAQA